jgi:Protein of unknown function (DUF3105)
MAKKKRRSSYTPPRTAGSGPPPAADAPASPSAAPRTRGATPPPSGAPSRTRGGAPVSEKQARRDEARRQREAARRRAARRRLLRRVIGGLLVLGAIALVVILLVRGSSTEPKLIAQPTAAEKAAGCTGLFEVPGYKSLPDRGHIGDTVASPPALSTYPTEPPASGPHDPTPLSAGVYDSPPDIYQAIHSLEHGATEVWLAPSVTGPDVAALKRQLRGGDKVIVAPYGYPGSSLPRGKSMVLTAWHRTESCRDVDLAVDRSFIAKFAFDASKPSAYEGVAPEKENGI